MTGGPWVNFMEAYWIVFVFIAALLVIRATLTGSTRALALLVREICLAASFYFVYYLVRGLVKDRADVARGNAEAVIGLERRTGLLHEPLIQRHVLESDLLTRLVNWVYVWWFWWPVIFGLCWLFLYHRELYDTYRNAFLISGGIGLIIFTVFPVAPPRFMPDFGVVDIVRQRSMSSHVLLPTGLANEYAAVPSLHAGWTLLIGIAFVRHASHLALRAFGVLLPALMFFSIVATGNHFIVDGLAGYAVVVAGLLLSVELTKRLAAIQPRLATAPIPVRAHEPGPRLRA